MLSATTAGPLDSRASIQIRCAEIWGGVSVRDAEFTTPGLQAAMHSSASGDQTGGDIYYFSVCGYESITRIAIADVRGHGRAVSHISEWIYQALATHMNDRNGAQVLTELNELVRKRGFEAITAAAVVTFHRDDRRLGYAYAGHPPVLLRDPGPNGAWRSLQGTEETSKPQHPANLPLGILSGVQYSQYETEIKPGQRLFLYSDGVSECPAAGSADESELYGDRSMLAALHHSNHLPIREACDAIRKDIHTFAGVSTLDHDDCTFLLAEPLAPAPLWKRRIFPRKLQRPSKMQKPSPDCTSESGDGLANH